MSKIVATVCKSPYWNEDSLTDAIKLGVRVFRMSSSFRTVEEDIALHKKVKTAIDRTTSLAEVKILYDINKGVKERLLSKKNMDVEKGQIIKINLIEDNDNNSFDFALNWISLCDMAEKGMVLNIGDGEVALEVKSIHEKSLECKVLNSGRIKARKAVNIEGYSNRNVAINSSNIIDIETACRLRFDYIALSFVKDVSDIDRLWKEIRLLDSTYQPKVIAKIETKEALVNIDSILDSVDGIMIARGDLALQVDFTKLGVIQKILIKKCQNAGKFCIVATQMLESVISRFVPARAEIIDITNAVLEGSDAVMLGPETCMNTDALRAISTMQKIITQAINYSDGKTVM